MKAWLRKRENKLNKSFIDCIKTVCMMLVFILLMFIKIH